MLSRYPLGRRGNVVRTSGGLRLDELTLDDDRVTGTVPQEVVLELYTALRPRRSTAAELEAWAARLEEDGAVQTAAFVREAAEVYATRGLLA